MPLKLLGMNRVKDILPPRAQVHVLQFLHDDVHLASPVGSPSFSSAIDSRASQIFSPVDATKPAVR